MMCNQSWPEQDAVMAWWQSHAHELKTAVSAYRIKKEHEISKLVEEIEALRETIKDMEEKNGGYDQITEERV